MKSRVFTVGHSTRTHEELFSLLDKNEISLLLDVRTYPSSKFCPQWNSTEIQSDLPAWLSYDWLPEIGGKRKPQPHSINTAWKNASFRSFADYMQTDEFLSGIYYLMSYINCDQTAIMCSEAVWWKCHRHLIADHLTGFQLCKVFHIMENGLNRHKMKEFAVVGNKTISYPGA
jgi:uncharacterized protein (DUF488 family)